MRRGIIQVDGFRIEDLRYLFESLQGLETVPDTCQPAKHRWYFNCHHLALISRSSIQNVNDKHAPLLHETIQTGLDDIAVGDQSAVPFIDAHSTAPRWAAVQTVFSVLWCLSVAFLLLWIESPLGTEPSCNWGMLLLGVATVALRSS